MSTKRAKRKPPPFVTAIRLAVQRIGKEKGEGRQSRYRLSAESGVSEAALSRFVSGERGLSAESLEALAGALGLEIVVQELKQPKANR